MIVWIIGIIAVIISFILGMNVGYRSFWKDVEKW